MPEQGETFDQVAELYDRYRSGVHPDVATGLLETLSLCPGEHVLEIGCGTGQLTGHLVEHGVHVTAIEPGRALAAVCQRKLGDAVVIHETRFEDWEPDRTYDAVVARQAAHWIVPETFLDLSHRALGGNGRLGLLWYVDASRGSPFWDATQHLYDRYLPDAGEKPPATLPEWVAAYGDAIASDVRFRDHVRRTWPWTRTFDEETYLQFIRTHSPVRLLSEADRDAFVAGHAEVIREFGGVVERDYETVLHAARCGVG